MPTRRVATEEFRLTYQCTGQLPDSAALTPWQSPGTHCPISELRGNNLVELRIKALTRGLPLKSTVPKSAEPTLPPSRFRTRLRKMSRGWDWGAILSELRCRGMARFLQALLPESHGCLWAPTTRA